MTIPFTPAGTNHVDNRDILIKNIIIEINTIYIQTDNFHIYIPKCLTQLQTDNNEIYWYGIPLITPTHVRRTGAYITLSDKQGKILSLTLTTEPVPKLSSLIYYEAGKATPLQR